MAEPVAGPTPVRSQHWTDWINVVAAVWLFLSPWILAFAGASAAAAWTAWATGIVIFVVALVSLRSQSAEWINVALGLWLFLSPWILGYARDRFALSTWIVGVVVFFSALGAALGPHGEIAHRHA